MAEPQTPAAEEADPAVQAEQWKALAEQSQRVVQAFLERQKEEDQFSVVDPVSIGKAFMEASAQMLSDPRKLAEAQMQLWQDTLQLWQSTTRRMLGGESEPVAEPAPGDRRFKDKAWSDDLAFDYIKQSYLLTSRWMQALVTDVEGLDPGTRDKVDFFTTPVRQRGVAQQLCGHQPGGDPPGARDRRPEPAGRPQAPARRPGTRARQAADLHDRL